MASYCVACGGALSDGANFCSVCGKAISNPVPIASGPARPLVRARNGRKIAGVCQGLANHYGWDVSFTRIITVLLAILAFPVGLVGYAICWMVVPEEPLLSPVITGLETTS